MTVDSVGRQSANSREAVRQSATVGGVTTEPAPTRR